MVEQPTEPICVYRAGNLQEAQLVVNLLENEGITARIASSAVETLAGEVPFQLAVCPIWVHQHQAELAQSIIEEHREEIKKPPRIELFCYHCGAELSQPVEKCPDCSSALQWEA